ncbi:helix-turn-helix domain-containing protein, partial [Streptomyces sp. SID5770]|nr:helix-turn-helix domain-containing protein [Streptomyces sp. SID5770]
MSERAPATGDFGGGPEGEAGAFGPRLRAFRRRAGMSQETAAARAGISTRALRDIERGRVQRPQSRTLQRLAGALGLSSGELGELLAADRAGAP